MAATLIRYPDENGQGSADIIDLLTMYPDTRSRIVRLLGELEASYALARPSSSGPSGARIGQAESPHVSAELLGSFHVADVPGAGDHH